MEQNSLDIVSILLESGLVVKGVLLILIFSSIFSWAIILQKRKQLKKVQDENIKFLNYFAKTSDLNEVNQNINKFSFSPIATEFEYGFKEFVKIHQRLQEQKNGQMKIEDYLKSNGLGAIQRSLEIGMNRGMQPLEQRLGFLASISSAAPFIGLFGTVWGIIDSFAGLAQGGGNIEAIAPGIAEALVATAVGLAAAIPALVGYNIISQKIQLVQSELSNFAQEFLNTIERNFFID